MYARFNALVSPFNALVSPFNALVSPFTIRIKRNEEGRSYVFFFEV